jgi:hypothetical protein
MTMATDPASFQDGSEAYPSAIAIEVKHATATHIAINNSDFVLVFSVVRPFFDSKVGLVPGAKLETVAAIDMNPVAAKQLARALNQAVTNFETATNSIVPDLGSIRVETGNTEKS